MKFLVENHMNLKAYISILAIFLSCSSFAMGSKRNKDLFQEDLTPVSKQALMEYKIKSPRSMDFLNKEHPLTAKISNGDKSFQGQKDRVFKDGWGREAYFHGWNINNTAKNEVYGYKPYENQEMAKKELDIFKNKSGSNIIRWLFSWKGGQPAVDNIDLKYFDAQIDQIKVAIKKGIYVMVDFHQDLFFGGAPKWVEDGMNLTDEKCPILQKLCDSTWAVNYVLNKRITSALEKFWNNDLIDTKLGQRKVQDEFVRMVSGGLARIKEKLTPQEFSYIIGLDPFNEPHYGGLSRRSKARKWVNNKLFPFYYKIQKAMNKSGWKSKLHFAEAPMMWNMRLPILAIAASYGSGTGLVKNPPKGPNWVFNAHFYDENREALGIISVKNGAYLKTVDKVREEARNLNMPPIITEFGNWPVGGGKLRQKASDTIRNLKATYQAMELRKTSWRGNKFVDFYSPFISRVQWVWHGLESSSTPKNPQARDRSYPRRVQGDLMTFYYNTTVKDAYKQREMSWVGVKPSGYKKGTTYFEKNKYAFLAWRGRKSEAPTEIYIPAHFDLSKTMVMTDRKILKNLSLLNMDQKGINDEIMMKQAGKESGSSLFIFDDKENSKKDESYHFALVVEMNTDKFLAQKELMKIHGQLISLLKREQSPLYLLGKVRIDNPLIK